MHVAFKHTLYGFQHNRSLRYYNIQNTIDSYASTTIHSIVRSAGSGNTHKRTEANLGRGKKVAENFFLANDNKTAVSLLRINNKSGRHLLKKAHDEKQAEAFYLFTDEREKQLLIVSGDERMQRILGYTDRPLAGNAIPDGLADLLDGYTAQYNALGNAAISAATTPTRSALYNGERLLSTAAWGQWAPFNNLTPQHYPTGCAATAMAIVMRYHQWPDVGSGSNSSATELRRVCSQRATTTPPRGTA